MKITVFIIGTIASWALIASGQSVGQGGAGVRSTAADGANILGVWRPTAVSRSADARAGTGHPLTDDVGITLEVFTPKHYSLVAQRTTTPRPAVPDSNVTLADVMAEWSPFAAQAGTYVIHADTLFRHAVVAKNPKAMLPSYGGSFVLFRIAGDTMWQTSIGGTLGRGTTIRYLRIERLSPAGP